jgi:hypothetical protein
MHRVECITLNCYTGKINNKIYLASVECLDGNHRLAAGFLSGSWNTIGDIPYMLLDVRVNGYNTSGYKLPRWIPKHIAQVSKFKWHEVYGKLVKGPTAQIEGDISSISSRIPEKYHGVRMEIVIERSLERIQSK